MKKRTALKSLAFSLIAISVGAACYADPVLSANHSNDANDANDAYALFVGPNQSGVNFYETLSKNLMDTSTIKVNLLVLGALSPLVNAAFSPNDPGTLFNFLKNFSVDELSGTNPQIFLMPDAEAQNLGSQNDWTNWGIANASILSSFGGPCAFDQNKPDLPYPTAYASSDPKKPDVTDVNAQEAQELMMTVCWASLMNKNLGSPLIAGLVYDGQSDVMASSDENLAWLKGELNFYATQKNPSFSSSVPDLLGWVHGGISNNVDISFVELYDQEKGAFTSLRMTEIAPESTYKMFDVADEIGPGAEGNCSTTEGAVCETKIGAIFPGEQYMKEVDSNGQSPSPVGIEGASISMCALASQSGKPDPSCNTYSNNIDTSQTIENQIMQSYLYIFEGLSKSQDFSELNNPFGPTPAPTTLIPNPRVIYLFSTQYFGPEEAATSTPTPCMLNLIDPNAGCGIENGFGVWNQLQYLQNFKNLTHQFLYYAQGCNTKKTPCEFDGNAGIYMYDFIPQAWYGLNTNSPED
jgi:hypothetical protein